MNDHILVSNAAFDASVVRQPILANFVVCTLIGQLGYIRPVLHQRCFYAKIAALTLPDVDIIFRLLVCSLATPSALHTHVPTGTTGFELCEEIEVYSKAPRSVSRTIVSLGEVRKLLSGKSRSEIVRPKVATYSAPAQQEDQRIRRKLLDTTLVSNSPRIFQ